MKRIFFDTNIMIDQFDTSRKGHQAATLLEQSMEKNSAQPLCAWHSLSIIEYIGAKSFAKDDLFFLLHSIVENYLIPPSGSEQAKDAFTYLHHDYEDALQIASAVCGRADYIVTNDKSGFTKSPIPVMTPKECAKQLKK
jgi:predicted nucleic acid-binding protein